MRGPLFTLTPDRFMPDRKVAIFSSNGDLVTVGLYTPGESSALIELPRDAWAAIAKMIEALG